MLKTKIYWQSNKIPGFLKFCINIHCPLDTSTYNMKISSWSQITRFFTWEGDSFELGFQWFAAEAVGGGGGGDSEEGETWQVLLNLVLCQQTRRWPMRRCLKRSNPMEQALFSLGGPDENSFTAYSYFVPLKVCRSATSEKGPGGGGLLSSSMCRIKYKSGSTTQFGGPGYIKELFGFTS